MEPLEKGIEDEDVKDADVCAGFHLSATVNAPQTFNQGGQGKGNYNVAVVFDRRRISSCSCSCNCTASWCCHIVALCLFRIHQVTTVTPLSFIFVVHQVRYAALLLPNCRLFGVYHCCRVYRSECVCCCKVYSTVCVLQVCLHHNVCMLQGQQVGVCLLLQRLFQSVCVAGLSIPQCGCVAGSTGQSVSVVARSIPQCVCCRFVYTTVCVLQVCLYQSLCVCCRVPISVFVVMGTIPVVVGTIQQYLLLWGRYDSVYCCGDYTTVFAVARTIAQCLWLRGL